MVYRSEQRYRANYLLLACGMVLIAASDRLVAYFDSVGGPTGQLWCGVGFVLGALLIAFGVRDVPQAEAGVHRRGLDWAQLVLPYSGFLGITVLLAFHLLTGNRLDAVVVSTTVVVVILVAARQAVAMDAQRKLTRRLYEAQRGLAYQVLHDAMTGLPNRLLFGQRLDDAMHGGRFMLIFVDLDDFKEVNDRFGHAAGDELLRAVGDRLQRCVTDADTLARIGGDEFAILIGGGLEKPEVVADRLRVALRAPFAVQGSSLRVRASMGLVRSSSDGLSQTSDDLLRQADVSMYASKRLGKNTAVVYQPTSGVQADFPSALRSRRRRHPRRVQPRLPARRAPSGRDTGGGGGPGQVDRTQRNTHLAADIRRGGRSGGAWCGAGRHGAGHGVRAGRGGRSGCGHSRQHRRGAAGKPRLRTTCASDAGAASNSAGQTGRGDHRDRPDRGSRPMPRHRSSDSMRLG